MNDDVLASDGGETEEEHLGADTGRDLGVDRDDEGGIHGEEHPGLTPPG